MWWRSGDRSHGKGQQREGRSQVFHVPWAASEQGSVKGASTLADIVCARCPVRNLVYACVSRRHLPGRGGTVSPRTYDGVGNRLTEALPGVGATSYTYDQMDRLLSAGATSYTSDRNGSRLSTGSSGIRATPATPP